LVEMPEGKNHSEDLGVDGITILKWIIGKQFWGVWTGFIWFMKGPDGGLLWTR
jgi:hypothetical protein